MLREEIKILIQDCIKKEPYTADEIEELMKIFALVENELITLMQYEEILNLNIKSKILILCDAINNGSRFERDYKVYYTKEMIQKFINENKSIIAQGLTF